MAQSKNGPSRPPTKYKSGKSGKGNKKFYTDQYKKWFVEQTKDLVKWTEYAAFCRRHNVDPQNANKWRRSKYPDKFPLRKRGPRLKKDGVTIIDRKTGEHRKLSKFELDAQAEVRAAKRKIDTLERQLLATDGGAALKLAEELEAQLEQTQAAYEKDLRTSEAALFEAGNRIAELNTELSTVKAVTVQGQQQQITKLEGELKNLQKTHNSLVAEYSEAADKLKHHNDVLTALSSLRKENEALEEKLDEIEQEVEVNSESAAEVEALQCLVDSLRAEIDAMQLNKSAPAPIDDVALSTIFWAGALSTGTMPDPLEVGKDIRRLIEKFKAGEL